MKIKNTPTVAVWLLTYNHVNFIEKTILSILNQITTFPIKLFIGDDFSNDGTRDVCRRLADQFPDTINLTLNKKNLGPNQNALNIYKKCFDSESPYIAMCEGDDYWTDPFKLQKQVDFLEANPEYVIAYHDAKVIDGNGVIIKDSKLPATAKKNYSAEELMKAYFVLTLSMCFRNCLGTFPPEFKKVTNGDSFLTSLLGQYGKGKFMEDVKPAIYRAHPEGVWSNLSQLHKLKRRLHFYFYITKYYNRLDYPSIRKYYIKKFDKLFEEYEELANESEEKYHLRYAKRIFIKSITIDLKKSRFKKIINMWLT